MTEKELAKILANNPDLSVIDDGRPAPRGPVVLPKSNALSDKFLSLWAQLGGQPLTAELRFHPTRRWRFDFAHEASKVAIEINGGVWQSGRHVRGTGYLNDREKINAATALGWKVFELGTGQVTPAAVREIVNVIENS